MSARDEFQNIAKAEKALCEELGPEIARVLRGIEERYGVQVNSLRMVGTHEASARWLKTTCTLIS